jgi:transposase-like protein
MEICLITGGLSVRCATFAALDLMDREGCLAFLVRRLHPGGGCCPHCGVSLHGRQSESFAAGGRICCNSCSRWSTWRTGTIFHRANLDDRQLYLLLMLTNLRCSIEDISVICRLSLDDAFSWQRRINEAAR